MGKAKPHERKGEITKVFDEYRANLVASTTLATYHAQRQGKRWVLTVTRERGSEERHEFDDEASLHAFVDGQTRDGSR